MTGSAPRVLVTGAGGLVGRHVLAPLIGLGFEVHATARRPPAGMPDVRWHAANLLDAAGRDAVIAAARPSHLLHLAWATGTGSVWQDPANRDWAAASLDLAVRFAAAGGRRWVGVGTCAEYDWSAEALATPCREAATPCRPRSLYGQKKLYHFQSIKDQFSSSSITFAWARLFHLFGPGDDPRRLVPYVICELAGGRWADCTDGTQLRDLLYAGDAGEGLARLLASDVDGAINLGSGRPVRLADAVREIGRQMGRPELIRLGARPPSPEDPAVLLPDLTRQTRELGWTAPTGLAQGIALTRAWWENIGLK